MTPEFLTGPLAQAVGWALLHLVWQGAIVAAILAAALALLQQKSANVRYAAACAALALLPLLAIATAWRCYEPLSIPAGGTMSLRAESLPSDVARVVVKQAAETALVSVGDVARSALPYVVLVWLAGVTLLSIRLFVGLSRVQRLAASALPASLEWEGILRRLSHALGLRYAVALLETAAAEVPTVVGWLRPVILLPASALSGLTADQIEMLLAHELAHIRRNDFFVNILQSAVETLMFYHPAVWWISNRIRVEREHCCDDLAVEVCGNAVQYARALTRLEELRAVRSGLVVAANGGSLVGRIRRLVGAPADATASASRWFAGLGVLAVVVVVLSVPTLPARAERESAQPVPKAKAVAPATPKAVAQPPHSSIEVTPTPPKAVATVDVDDPDVDLDFDFDVPMVAPVPPTPAVPPTFAPMVRAAALEAMDSVRPALAAVAPHIAAAVSTGVRGGIAGGVRGGVAGGVHGGIAEGIHGGIAERISEGIAGALAEMPPLARSHTLRDRKFGASGKLTVDELIELRSSGVTPEYISEIRGAGLGDLTLGEISGLSVMRVKADYIKGLRAAGVDIKNASDAMSAKAMRISPEYVKEMGDAGYPNLSLKDLVELKAMRITAAYVKSLSDAGYTNLSARDLIRLAASGVNSDFIREISQYRDKK